jgi:hypothetical protein
LDEALAQRCLPPDTTGVPLTTDRRLKSRKTHLEQMFSGLPQ